MILTATSGFGLCNFSTAALNPRLPKVPDCVSVAKPTTITQSHKRIDNLYIVLLAAMMRLANSYGFVSIFNTGFYYFLINIMGF